MSIDQVTQAARDIRKTHDAVALKTYIDSSFPPADDVEPSKVCNPDNYLRDFPVDLDARIAAMQVRIQHTEATFFRAVSRYTRIRENGLAALDSREIMFNGSGDPKMAINSLMLLYHSHIAAHKVMLPRYRELLAQWQAERDQAGHQLMIF
jgi:hypothetical protein